MEARITWRSELFIKGDTLEEIKRKFENLDLGLNSSFVENLSIEDVDTEEDLTSEFNLI